MSSGVRCMRSPIWAPLLRMERWLRQAAFGMAVVPDVNWMFTISSGERFLGGSGRVSSEWSCSDMMDEYGVRVLNESVLTRPCELSTRIILLSVGTTSDSSFDPDRSCTR